MTNRDIKAIKAAEIIKQYCIEIGCTDCIFNFHGGCILSDSNGYIPLNWCIDLIKESGLHGFNGVQE